MKKRYIICVGIPPSSIPISPTAYPGLSKWYARPRETVFAKVRNLYKRIQGTNLRDVESFKSEEYELDITGITREQRLFELQIYCSKRKTAPRKASTGKSPG